MLYTTLLINVINFFTTLADAKRRQFASDKSKEPSIAHVVNRRKIFNQVIDLFSDDAILKEYPLYIKFEGEIAVDSGGVQRDMLSAFWEEVYVHFFDGSSLLVPTVHPNVDMSLLPKLGLILSHGYLVCGFLPTRIAFPALVSILNPPVTFPTSMLVPAFADSLSVFEAATVREALAANSTTFSDIQNNILMTIFSRYGCREYPTPKNIHSLTENTARFEFTIKPMAAYSMMSSGIPLEERLFWQSFSLEELHSLYMAINATPGKVLALFQEPTLASEAEQRVFTYLQQFVGNMKVDELRSFLRFTTGSSALMAENIIVTFNSTTGMARRPIAHTCGCVLELPSSYVSYLEFEAEFSAILSNEYSWEMHGV